MRVRRLMTGFARKISCASANRSPRTLNPQNARRLHANFDLDAKSLPFRTLVHFPAPWRLERRGVRESQAFRAPSPSYQLQIRIDVFGQGRRGAGAQRVQGHKSNHRGVVGAECRRRELQFETESIAFALKRRA